MARRQRAASDAPDGSGSIAERPPRSRGVAWLGFIALLALLALFAHSALSTEPVNVPHGLLGLRFGISEAEAKAKLPELASNAAGKLTVATSVFEAPADCVLGFVDGELARVECEVQRTLSIDDQHRLKRRIVATVRQLYGDESEWKPGEREHWSWRSSRAELLVISEGDALRVENARLIR